MTPTLPLRRRGFLTRLCACATAAASIADRASAQGRARRRTFVLVHGAWHGGWCWRRVTDLLEAAGHKVFAPTLTGLADRSHLLGPSVTLDTHITDIANLLEWEDLQEVVLVGHSYAGFVIAGVAERTPARLSALVFLDAYVPRNGERMYDLAATTSRESLDSALKSGAATRPAPSAASFRVNEGDRAWVDSKMTPQPVNVAMQRIRLSGAVDRIGTKVYIRATGYPNTAFDAALAVAGATAGWRTFRIDAGHDVMIDAPERLTSMLVEQS